MSFFKSKNVKRNLAIVLAVFSSCVLLFNSNLDKNSAIEVRADKASSDAVAMYTVPSSDKVFINGVVTPSNTETYTYTSEYGTMENVKVQSGEYVDKGYHMFSYRNTNIEEQVASLEEEIADIEENIKELQTNSTENKDQILYLNNKVKETKAEMDELKSKVVTNVYAPFSGEIHIETNTRSSEETEMTIMLDTKEYYLEGLISEQDYAKVNVGSATDIYLFSTKESRRGTITFMSKRPESTLDEESKNSNLSKYRVKISFSDQSNLVNGYHAQAKIDMDNKEIKIPTTAIITEDEKFYVLVDEMGVAKKREVVTSFAETDAMAIIESGLSENEVIVENVKTSKVKDGDNLYSSSLEF